MSITCIKTRQLSQIATTPKRQTFKGLPFPLGASREEATMASLNLEKAVKAAEELENLNLNKALRAIELLTDMGFTYERGEWISNDPNTPTSQEGDVKK